MGFFAKDNTSKKTLKETLDQLKEAEEELLQASKMVSLGQMAAGAIHEIKNLLFVLAGQLEVLKAQEDFLPLAKQTVESMGEQVCAMQEIVQRLLDFSRKKETKRSVCDVNKILKNSIELVKYQTKVRDKVRVAEELSKEPLVILGDPNQLQEVFLNLLMNASEAMEEKGGILTVRSFSKMIEHLSREENSLFKIGDQVIDIEFSDTGFGIDEETKNKIFKPFFTTKKTGTGLGLSLCFNIIESHQGRIYVDSKKGVGTTFTVRLPLSRE